MTQGSADGARLDRAWIAAHIPHGGRMCLLDEVLEWDADRILCRAADPRAADHPLRLLGRLGAVAGIEYAAQAMAVHGALTAPAAQTPVAGFLASLREVSVHAGRLDDIEGELLTGAVRIAGDAAGAAYEFELRSAQRVLLRGRATVMFDAGVRLESKR
jgi:predicted hotdog family 3-hydroxylacyl-ACP dehydratase